MKTSVTKIMMSFALMGCLIFSASDAMAQGRSRSQGGSTSSRSQSAAVSRPSNQSTAPTVSRNSSSSTSRSSATPQVSRSSSSSSHSSATPQVSRSSSSSSRSSAIPQVSRTSTSVSDRSSSVARPSSNSSSQVTRPTTSNSSSSGSRPGTGASTRGDNKGNKGGSSTTVTSRSDMSNKGVIVNKGTEMSAQDRNTVKGGANTSNNNVGKPNNGTKPNGGKPDTGSRPNGGGKPDNGGKPNGGGKPDTGGKPDNGGKPNGGGKPDNGGKPNGGVKPDNGGRPHGGDRSNGGTRPHGGGKPDGGRPHGYDHNNHFDYNGHHYANDFHHHYTNHSWSWSRPLPPPARPYRPAPLVWYRPVIPVGWYPYASAPIIDRILGITFGTLFDTSLDYLYYNGYEIDGYADHIIYLRDVPLLNLTWDDAMLCYDSYDRLVNAQFIYVSSINNHKRYDRVYRNLCRVYGSPFSNSDGSLSWYGGNNTGWITLSTYTNLGRCYTTMSIGY